MDAYFECFTENMGPSHNRVDVAYSTVQAYRNKLPDQLLTYWQQHGWSGYANGNFWTVNPGDYDGVVHQWLLDSGTPDPDKHYVIARGAFGDLYLWAAAKQNLLTINVKYARYTAGFEDSTPVSADEKIRSFFTTMSPEYNDFDDLFEKALKKLGPLKSDEMYGFLPALALGGPSELKNLQKVKIIEHLAFLSQLSPLTDWGFPDFETIMKLTE
ncbi:MULTISPECIES: GAD-like domain-containing protein [unclassified Pseudomonas]|uniref:GAD-like domain-containing protein n=1 Tax=unclassified Pseudomonas TaxID=196821 RepID=UPI00384CE1B0